MSKGAMLLYAGQLVQEFESGCFSMKQYLHTTWGLEIYNGGYVYMPSRHESDPVWYRPDLTPVLLADVPKELRLLVLLLK